MSRGRGCIQGKGCVQGRGYIQARDCMQRERPRAGVEVASRGEAAGPRVMLVLLQVVNRDVVVTQ